MRIYTIDRCAYCGCKHRDVEGEWRCFHPKIGGKKKVDPATLPDWCPHPEFKAPDSAMGSKPAVADRRVEIKKGAVIKKLLEIDDCYECKHRYYKDMKWHCRIKEKPINRDFTFPDWCPLLDFTEKEE